MPCTRRIRNQMPLSKRIQLVTVKHTINVLLDHLGNLEDLEQTVNRVVLASLELRDSLELLLLSQSMRSKAVEFALLGHVALQDLQVSLE